jgi:tripartite ATP-independent transporter DctM subunit
MNWALLAVLLFFAAAGTPIFALIGGAALALFHFEQISPSAAIIEMARLSEMPSLITIPLFTFAGYVLAESGAPTRILDLGEALFGWLPGGVAVAALSSCALFTAFTGASGVTIIALGGLILPLLRKQRYPESFSLGLVTTTGSLGLLFPPSLPIILYALVGGISLNRLFAAAAVPGIILLVILSAYAVVTAAANRIPRSTFSAAKVASAVRAAIWEIPLPFLIIGGIYTGMFTASEASAIMAFYVLVIEVFFYRDITLRKIPGVIARSQLLVGAILIVLGTALGLTNYMIDAQIPERLFAVLSTHISLKWEFLACLNVFLLVVNMVEIFSAIIIIVPIIVPVALKYHIDPFHLGALFLMNLEIGYLTPPMGLNLFLSSRRFEKPLSELYAASFPFWLIMLATLAAVTYIPGLSLWLPTAFHIQ